ncbi:MAG: PEP-CTERM sorting domain-containing protein [Phycisphaerales bacterium]|nr:PEP-CTERM sorting domain-containing protein [Phycisphaerales bacterium]
MNRTCVSAAVVAGGLTLLSNAGAAITITQTVAAAPSYTTKLNFDAPGSPTGVPIASNSFASYGISNFGTGDNPNEINVGQVNTNPGFGWLGTGNVAFGTWGLFMTFSNQLTEFSGQYWDDSGPGSAFGGGAVVVALKNGAEVGSLFLTAPAFNPSAKSWINITTSGGDTFDEVRMVGFGFFPTAYADNLSWNVAVPAPSSLGVLALGGIIAGRRRRA